MYLDACDCFVVYFFSLYFGVILVFFRFSIVYTNVNANTNGFRWLMVCSRATIKYRSLLICNVQSCWIESPFIWGLFVRPFLSLSINFDGFFPLVLQFEWFSFSLWLASRLTCDHQALISFTEPNKTDGHRNRANYVDDFIFDSNVFVGLCVSVPRRQRWVISQHTFLI